MILKKLTYSQKEIKIFCDSVKNNTGCLIKALHTTVSVVILLSLIFVAVTMQYTKEHWYKVEFLTHGFKYVTHLFSIWVSVCQVLFFYSFTVIDIIDVYSNKRPFLIHIKNALHRVAGYLLFTVVFPLSLLVTVLFWTFYYLQREAMYPEVMDEIFPPLLNHIMHTFPPIFAVIYMATSNKEEPPKAKALSGLLLFLAVYAACLTSIRLRDGRWVYLVLEVLSPFEVKCIFIFCFTSSVLFLLLGYEINSMLKGLKRKIFEPEKIKSL